MEDCQRKNLNSFYPALNQDFMFHQHKGASLAGMHIMNGDVIIYTQTVVSVEDGIYVFAMQDREFCRYLKFIDSDFVEIYDLTNAVAIDDLKAEKEKINLSALQLKGKIYATIHTVA